MLARITNQEILAFTSTHVLSEVAHHLMTLEAANQFGWSSKVVQRLKQQPTQIQKLTNFRKSIETVAQGRASRGMELLLKWVVKASKENAMTMPGKALEHRENDPKPVGTERHVQPLAGEAPHPAPLEESLGEQLIREAREGDAEFVAGWRKFMEELGIDGEPIGAKRLRERLLQEGIDPEGNDFSRGIIAMREE